MHTCYLDLNTIWYVSSLQVTTWKFQWSTRRVYDQSFMVDMLLNFNKRFTLNKWTGQFTGRWQFEEQGRGDREARVAYDELELILFSSVLVMNLSSLCNDYLGFPLMKTLNDLRPLRRLCEDSHLLKPLQQFYIYVRVYALYTSLSFSCYIKKSMVFQVVWWHGNYILSRDILMLKFLHLGWVAYQMIELTLIDYVYISENFISKKIKRAKT